MSVLQRVIELSGVATTSISLVRRMSEAVKPPRALWVPFPFGRPLGAPRNVAVQRLVIMCALRLLERPAGPVLEDLALPAEFEHLDARYQIVGRSCGADGCSIETLTGGHEPPQPKPYDSRFDLVLADLAGLAAAHERYRRENGARTQVGQSGVTPQSIADAARVVEAFLADDSAAAPHRSPEADDALRKRIRLSIDDLKAFSLEARLVDDELGLENAARLNDWLWLETRLGSFMIAARDHLIATTDRNRDPNWILARGIVPRGYGSSGYPMTHVVEE